MASPNKLTQFWQELKRRRVHRMLAIYAGSAYVIFEATTLIFPRWGLPDWTIDLVLYLLILGAIITFVVSWIYDITPEGIRKTIPVGESSEVEAPSTPNGWKVASYISIVVIVGLVVLNIIPRANNKKILDKSIAVLPFRNDSPDQERMYFINGTMEAILDNLCKIEDLRVPGRTSVEQYRDNPKPIPVVAEEMSVSYVLEGSGHRDGNNVRLFVQLLDGKNDQHLWSKSYDTDIEEIFNMQSEIAQLVAAEIEAIITPEEKQRIDRIPTTDLTAYDFYLQGEDELWDHWINHNQAALDRAKKMFNKALDYDSTYAQAFVGLGHVYWQNHLDMLSENYMDSVLFYANKALSCDNQLASAYTLKGSFFIQRQMPEKALVELDKALALNPNYSEVFSEKGRLYGIFLKDFVLSLLNYHKAAELTHGKKLPEVLKSIGYQYIQAGFSERGMQFSKQAMELDGDSASYYSTLSSIKFINQDYVGARDLLLKAYKYDSNIVNIYGLGMIYMFLGEDEESLCYWQMLRDEYGEFFSILGLDKIGYTYWKIENHEKANDYFNKAIELNLEAIENEVLEPVASLNLAAIYAVRGERNKALEYLKRYSVTAFDRETSNTMIDDPRFNSMRDDPAFKQIVRDVEAKYQAEHERVRQWLEENDML